MGQEINAIETSLNSKRCLSLLETFALFKKYVSNCGSPKQYPPHLLFDRSVTSITPTNEPHTHHITFDTRRKIWQQEVLPWLSLYEPAKKFDENLCYDCSIHHAPGQGEWISKLTKTSGDQTQSGAIQNDSFSYYEKLQFHNYPQHVKAFTRVMDQCYVHDGHNVLAYASWTPLLSNLKTYCYSCDNHPKIPKVFIYLKPFLSSSLKEHVIKATKEKIKQHIHLTQSNNPGLINQLIDAYENACDYKHRNPTINEYSRIPFATFTVFSRQNILRLFPYTSEEKATELITLGDYLKYPGRTYPEYETQFIQENKQIFLQHFKHNAQSYNIENFYTNSLDDYINTIDNNDNYVLHVLSKKNALTPSGLMLVRLEQDNNNYGKKDKTDLIVMSIYPKEKGTFRVFDNYAYNFLSDINKCALWHLYKTTLKHHPSFKPSPNEYISGQFPTAQRNLKTLFTYMI